MKRYVDMADISDGKYYSSGDLVKAGCSGCGSCCRGMGKSIVLDPLDIFRTFACSRILRFWESKLDGPDNYDLATTDTLAHTSGMYKYSAEKKEEE